MNPSLTLEILPGRFQVSRLHPDTDIPESLVTEINTHISRTSDELSILTSVENSPKAEESSQIMFGFRIQGTLDHGLIGIIARVSEVLAQEQIPLFTISTFDTDYFYCDEQYLDSTKLALLNAGCVFA